ncbi:MAG TPA: hypothetical protein CFH84_12070 [Sulfurimonas sp. UBA12504]|nr:MAG: hypothetical protein A2019_08150 [Sulfurimonas sp. GWF2_37_8]DAB28960.1 MAG TPA: hypothetical protein CFH84_12070 [Sulfurimonas sp. UBA12504]
MIKITLLTISLLFFSGCFNKNGVSMKYYSECEEYYDLQGYYHKDCGKDDIVSYEQMKEVLKKKKEPEPEQSVW